MDGWMDGWMVYWSHEAGKSPAGTQLASKNRHCEPLARLMFAVPNPKTC